MSNAQIEVKKALLTAFYSAERKQEDVSSKLVTLFLDEFKKYKDLGADFVVAAYQKAYEEVDKRVLSQRKYNNVLKTAHKYWAMKALTYYSKLEYSTLNEVVKLLWALRENDEALKKCRNKLGRVKGTDDIDYNNNMYKRVRELRKEYGVVDIDGATVVSNLEKKIDKLTQEQKRELYEWLKGKVETEDEEEVAA